MGDWVEEMEARTGAKMNGANIILNHITKFYIISAALYNSCMKSLSKYIFYKLACDVPIHHRWWPSV